MTERIRPIRDDELEQFWQQARAAWHAWREHVTHHPGAWADDSQEHSEHISLHNAWVEAERACRAALIDHHDLYPGRIVRLRGHEWCAVEAT